MISSSGDVLSQPKAIGVRDDDLVRIKSREINSLKSQMMNLCGMHDSHLELQNAQCSRCSINSSRPIATLRADAALLVHLFRLTLYNNGPGELAFGCHALPVKALRVTHVE